MLFMVDFGRESTSLHARSLYALETTIKINKKGSEKTLERCQEVLKLSMTFPDTFIDLQDM